MIVKFIKDFVVKKLNSPEYYTHHLGRWRRTSQDFNNLTANYDQCGDESWNIENMKKSQEISQKTLKKLKFVIDKK